MKIFVVSKGYEDTGQSENVRAFLSEKKAKLYAEKLMREEKDRYKKYGMFSWEQSYRYRSEFYVEELELEDEQQTIETN